MQQNSPSSPLLLRWRPQFVAQHLRPALPAMIVFLVFLPVLGADFVWDDRLVFVDMHLYRSGPSFGDVLLQSFVLSPNYFRPLVVFTFVAELSLWGLWPVPFHLTNLLLHACNTALVTGIAAHVLAGSRQSVLIRHQPEISSEQIDSKDAVRVSELSSIVAIFAGLLYGLHPALIEGVAFVSSRFDLAVTTFLLLALWLDLGLHGRVVARAILVGIMFFLAALSKEMAAAFVLVLPLWHVVTEGTAAWRRRGWVYLSLIVAGLLYLLLRWLALGRLFDPAAQPLIPTGSGMQHLLLVARSAWEYLLLTVFPFSRLTPVHWSELPVPMTSIRAWSSLVGLLGALFGLVWLVRRSPRVGWLGVAFALALLPVINIVPLEIGGGAFIAERYLTFPLTLAALAVTLLLAPLARPRVRALAMIWLVVCVAVVQLTVPHWRDELALWSWGTREAPHSSLPFSNLALELIRRRDYPGAQAAAEQAIVLDPQSSSAIDNRGLALFHMARYPEAQAAFEAALKIDPENALYLNNLAGALREQGKLQEAERLLRDEVLVRAPNMPVAYVNLGLVYLQADRPDLAGQYLEQALRMVPPGDIGATQALLDQVADPQRWIRLGYLLLDNNDPTSALKAFERATEFNAPPIDVIAGRSSALIQQEKWADAEIVLQSALALGVEDARIFNNLGLLAAQRGDTAAATSFYTRATELAPDWPEPSENLQALNRP